MDHAALDSLGRWKPPIQVGELMVRGVGEQIFSLVLLCVVLKVISQVRLLFITITRDLQSLDLSCSSPHVPVDLPPGHKSVIHISQTSKFLM